MIRPSLNAFRNAALGVGAGLAMLFPQTGQALTKQDCKGFAGITGEYVKAQPKGTFSTVFLDSVKLYAMPEGKLTCTGNGKIVVSSLDDFTGWINIENLSRSAGIDVDKEVTLVLASGSDPKLPTLLAQRNRSVGRQASLQ